MMNEQTMKTINSIQYNKQAKSQQLYFLSALFKLILMIFIFMFL